MKSKLKANKHESYTLYTVIAFLLPVVGIILGIVYISKNKPLDKKLGEHLIAISILFLIAQTLLWYLVFGKSTITTYSPPATSSATTITDSPATSSWSPDSYYEQIQNGQTKAQVEALIKKSPESCSTTEASGVGKMESCNYGSYTDKGILSITYLNGKVYNKTKINL